MSEWWVIGLPWRRKFGPYGSAEEAAEARELVATQEYGRLRQDARGGVLITDEEIRRRLHRIRVVRRSSAPGTPKRMIAKARPDCDRS